LASFERLGVEALALAVNTSRLDQTHEHEQDELLHRYTPSSDVNPRRTTPYYGGAWTCRQQVDASIRHPV
jgi:hypothetical protein